MRMTAIVLLALPIPVSADEIVLKNGKKIPFRVLSDGIDVVRVQTPDNRTLEIPKGAIRDVRFVVPKAPLTGATFTDDDTEAAAKPVNLFRSIDPKKHGVMGEWRYVGRRLQGSKGLLEVPYVPATSSYDVEIALYRMEGPGAVTIGLTAEGRAFGFIVDWSDLDKGEAYVSGLVAIGPKRVYANETRINGQQLPRRKLRHVVCAVRPGRVVVLMDGKEVVNWKGDLKALSHPARPKNEPNLFLTVGRATIAVQKYVVTERRVKAQE